MPCDAGSAPAGQTGWAAISTIPPDSGALAHHPFVPQIRRFVERMLSGVESHCYVADAVKTRAILLAESR
jgi:hypothetical protein